MKAAGYRHTSETCGFSMSFTLILPLELALSFSLSALVFQLWSFPKGMPLAQLLAL